MPVTRVDGIHIVTGANSAIGGNIHIYDTGTKIADHPAEARMSTIVDSGYDNAYGFYVC
ncbi:hypothetical protein EC912_101377 [Luteibacter rhizovicinus]|uniref:Uncharacterized protein n=1 Tax=Luteibacter rhizovicinus TaxID=242606 RepID=A0A4R3YZM4_9GAMM|nr:hypothetical protein [Luteibacter rhizovicinus]TCV97368.1 hypothetical protein EC912_101377 [Luteibacter rhizovicinus]